MPIIEGTDRLKTAIAEYDFAVDGGAIGSIPMRGGTATLGGGLQSGAVVMSGYIEVDTPLTSGGAATVAVTSEGAGDIQAAAVVTGAPWSTTGRKAVTFTGAKMTANRTPTVVVAAFALTAGKFRVVLVYR